MKTSAMKLTRREIFEELGRLGIRTLCELKRACREYEVYWDTLWPELENIQVKQNDGRVFLSE